MLNTLPPLTSLADLLDLIATRRPCEDAPADYKPADGWHTIRVANGSYGDSIDPGSLRIWMRLFEQYAKNRKGTVYWADAPYLDREKREIAARFQIAPAE